jgi:hypothetical protein
MLLSMPAARARLALLGSLCVATAPLMTLGGCDERRATKRAGYVPSQPRPLGKRLAKPPPRQAPLPPDGIDPLVPYPQGVGAKTLALCTAIDRGLRAFGETLKRTERFLSYQRRCEGVAKRFGKLERRLMSALAKRRTALLALRAKLSKLPAAERPAFWAWLRKLRHWTEDDLATQAIATERAASTFGSRCDRAARKLAKAGSALDWMRVEALVVLHQLFTTAGAPKESAERPGWRAIRSLVDATTHRPPLPLPARLSAATRRDSQRLSHALAASVALVRTYGEAFRGEPSCTVLVKRIRQRDGMKRLWREIGREIGRSYAALRALPKGKEPKVDRWAYASLRRIDKQIIREARQQQKKMMRLARRCPRRVRRLSSTYRKWPSPKLAGYVEGGLAKGRRTLRRPRNERDARRLWRRLLQRRGRR